MADYARALRFPWLTAAYDPVVGLLVREERIKGNLLGLADLAPGQRVLDVGCGTGTLAIKAAEQSPGLKVVGVDGDDEVLERAERKAAERGKAVRFERALSNELPYEDASFDRVLSTLFFHHLSSTDKATSAAEICRVLRPSGQLHVADFGRPSDPMMWFAFTLVRSFDGFERTSQNFRGELPAVFERAGLAVSRGRRYRTVFGSVELLSATKA